MERNYDKEFGMCKLVAGGILVSAGIITVVVEFSVSKFSPFSLSQMMSPDQFQLVSTVFGIVAGILAAISVGMRVAIRRTDPGRPLKFIAVWANQLIRRQSGAMAMLIPPMALCEMIVVLGAVLFVLSGGERMPFYIAVVTALPLFLIAYPGEKDKETLAALDKSIRDGMDRG